MGLANDVGNALDAFSGAVAVQSGTQPQVGSATNAWSQPVSSANTVTPGLLGTAYDVGTAPNVYAASQPTTEVPGSQTTTQPQNQSTPPSGGGGGIFGAVTRFAHRTLTDVGSGIDKLTGNANVVHDMGHALTNLAQWDRDAYTAVISRPVSTLFNEGTNVRAQGFSSLFRGNTWNTSWNESKYISPGQAAEQFGRIPGNLFLGGLGAQAIIGHESAQAAAQQLADPNYIQQTYGQNGSFAVRSLSGGNDAVLNWSTDPLVVAGKAFTLTRDAQHGTEAIGPENIDKAIAKPSAQAMLKKTATLNAYQAKQMPWIAKSANPDLLAGIFNKTVDPAIKDAAYRMALSQGQDLGAGNSLAQMATKNEAEWGTASDQAASAREAIANANQPFNADVQLANFMGNGGSFQDYMQAQNAALDDAEKKLNLLGTQARVLNDVQNMGGIVHWQPGRFDVPIAKLRAAFTTADKFGDSSAISGHLPLGSTAPGKWVYQTLYKGLYNTPLKVLRAFSDQWPEGWLDLSNVKSSDWLEGYMARAKGLDPNHARTLMDNYLNAGGNAQQKLVAAQEIEHAAMDAVLQRRGFSPEDSRDIIGGTWDRRNDILAGYSNRVANAKSRGYSGAIDPDTGMPVDTVVTHLLDDDGTPIHVPILDTMKSQGAVMMDLDALDKWARVNIGHFQTIKKGLNLGESAVGASGDLFTSLWKNSVLLRLGFTPRVMTDMGFRSLATMGPARVLGATREAAGVAMHNAGVRAGSFANNLLKGRLFEPDTVITDNMSKVEALTNARDIARADYLHTALMKSVNDQAHDAGLDYLEGSPTADVVANKLQTFHDAEDQLTALRNTASPFQKALMGNGRLKYKGVHMQDVFGGENPEWRMNQVSSARMIGHMFTKNADMADGLFGTGNWDTLRSNSLNELEQKSHMPAWAHSVNNQIMKDPLASKVVRNNWHEDDVQQWFRTVEGRDYLKNAQPAFRANPEDYANRIVQHVHYTVPPVVRDFLNKSGRSTVSAKDLEKLVPQAGDRPDVNGQILALNTVGHNGVTNMMQHWQHAMHKFLGSMPLDTFVYHPTAAALYRGHLQDAVDKYVSFNGLEDAHTLEFNDALRSKLENGAFQSAKSDLWNIMYDLSMKSTAAHQLRFIFPFFNAQQEILRHWFNIALDHPAIVQRGQMIWNSPEKAGIVYDSQTGDQANQDTPVENRVVRFQIPHAISNLPGLGVLDDMGQMQINKQSINPILQGKTWYIPGAGPIVQVGVQALAGMNPGILDNGVLKTVLPYGPGDNLSAAILPTWAKRLETGINVSNPQYATTFAKVYQTETIRYNEGLRSSAPSMSEIASRTRQLLILQAISSATLPFSATYNPGTQRSASPQRTNKNMVPGTTGAPDLTHVPIQALVDQYRKMEAANPSTAMNAFYQKYGQALFVLTMATTKTNADIPSTAQGLADLDNPDIRALVAQDPSIAYAIVGPTAAQGPFDQAAYNALLNTQIGGGNTLTFKSRMSPEDMVKENNAELGWQEYDQLTSAINAKMAERGVTSLNQRGAQDLKALKAQFVYNMNTPGSNDYNPDWYSQYTGKGVDWNQRIQSLTNLVSDPNLVNNPSRTDLQSLGTYLEGRQELNGILASRPNKEGLPSAITDKSNADVASLWDNFVSGLVMGNTQFALLYQHLLAGDPLSTGLKSNDGFQQSLSGIVGQ